MVWVIVIAAIFVVLFLMILAPKAAKGYTDSEKLKDVAWGRGFSRIYFIASAAWIGGFFWMLVTDPDVPQSRVPLILAVILAPIPLYFFIKFIFGGFKKEEEVVLNKRKKKKK